MTKQNSSVVALPVNGPRPAPGTRRCSLTQISEDGTLWVRDEAWAERPCDWLDTHALRVDALNVGDTVLVQFFDGDARGVVLGRVGPYRAPSPAARFTLEATEVLTLKCGDATLDLRADGKAVLKGDDVLIRARGLQRIKAGSVSIN
ncbi:MULTISPECIES: hypothetical protein [Niveibacterium]|uniref:Gp5/Type VI secretion system Vgr protein OB-fold domain-containing protein n=1 Tax=Niveibacterium microcysteis TaxID=2811415 RepID=A0ABX7MB61_9RHOO|nr:MULTISPECIES: hypothetical protein [Niveibacterium]QSI78981.1 hypothetical protein JY500_10370 [Niveibacterium microcysteis]